MAKDYIDDGGLKVPSKAESLEHAQISGVHGKKVFVVDSAGNQIDAATQSTLEDVLTELEDVNTELEKKTEPNDIQMSEVIPMLRTILNAIANPSYVDKSANAIRNQVQSGTVTTVSTVTTLTNFGSQGADVLYRIQSNTAWAVNIRSLIT